MRERSAASAGRSHPGTLEMRSYVGASIATSLAHEPRLDVGQPHIIRPAIRRHGNAVRAAVVGAVDEDPARAAAAGSHFAKRDFPGAHASRLPGGWTCAKLRHQPGLLRANHAGAEVFLFHGERIAPSAILFEAGVSNQFTGQRGIRRFPGRARRGRDPTIALIQ